MVPMTEPGQTSHDGHPKLLVRVEPEGIVVEVPPGETTFEAAIRQGISWPTICEGMGSCRSCFMSVLAGADQLDEIDDWEQEGIDRLGGLGHGGGVLRLACQATAAASAVNRTEVVVFKRGVSRMSTRAAADETERTNG